MIVNLSEIQFVNDFAYVNCPSGATLVLNKLDENIADVLKIRNVNIALVDTDGNYFDCNMAIGLSNDYIRLFSDYKEQEGQVLTIDNIELCQIEVFDETE